MATPIVNQRQAETAATKQRINHPAGAPGAVDWRKWLEDWGFPKEVVKNIDQLARRYTPDQHESFAHDAILYLRGTDWHRKTFPGFAEAIKSGVVADEKGYRQYTQQSNDLYKRFHGRGITTAELIGGFKSGYDVDRVGRELEGQAFINANRNDLQAQAGAFGAGRYTEAELKGYGQQKAGVSNALGEDLIRRVGVAQQRMRRIFEGTLAGGNQSLESGGLSSPSLRSGSVSDTGR